MFRNNSKLLKILFSLFCLNSVTLYLYFHNSDQHSRHDDHHDDKHAATHVSLSETHHLHPPAHHFSKPWPILPSYLPWSPDDADATYRSCEAYFGNGFNTRIDLLPNSGQGGGWFRCYYSETLKSSICEGGKIKMNNERIKMSRGGENVEDVIGRGEEEEMPKFENGAFLIEGDEKNKNEGKRLADDGFLKEFVPRGEISMHTMRELIGSIQVVNSKEFDDCDQWIEEPTLLVTRFEYANVFHTFTDWYSAYVSSRVTGLPSRPHVVFVDGHSKTQLEETWKALFSSIRYAKNFTGSVCFRHAILSPLGYETALFKGLSEQIDCEGGDAHDLWKSPDERKTARLSEFGEMVRASFGLQLNRHRTEKSSSGHNILFVRREDYLAHPRHGGKVESRLANEKEVFDSLQKWVSSNKMDCKVNLVNGLFAHMSMKDQVQAIQDASVIVGAHGAGLTHTISATPKTVVLEIISSQFRRPHFQLIAQWKGLEYHAINLHGSYANPGDVIENLKTIIKRLEC